MDKYYLFDLPDCAAPAFVTFNKFYLGTMEGYSKIKLKSEELIKYDVEILRTKTLSRQETYDYSHTNIWGCEDTVRMSGYTVEYILCKYENRYLIYAFATVQNAETYAEVKDVWIKFGRMFWGLPGQIQKTISKDGTITLSTALAYKVKGFTKESEAVKWLNSQTEPDLKGFFDDIYGDG